MAINSPTYKKDDNIFKKYAKENDFAERNVFDVIPASRLESKIKSDFSDFEYPFSAFMFKRDVPIEWALKENFCVVCLNCINGAKSADFYVCVYILDDVSSAVTHTTSLFVNNAFLKLSPLRIASKVALRLIEEKQPKIDFIKLKTNNSVTVKHFRQYLEKCLENQKFIILNPGLMLQISENQLVNLEFENNYCVVDANFLKNCEYTVEFSEEIIADANSSIKSDGYYEVVNETLENGMLLAVEINLKFNCNENVLIVGKQSLFAKLWLILLAYILGKRGTGKTALLQRISQKLTEPQYKIHTELVSCKTIKGKSGESLQRHLFPIIARLIYYQPSVLIFDDFDVICAKTFSPDPPTPESLYYDR